MHIDPTEQFIQTEIFAASWRLSRLYNDMKINRYIKCKQVWVECIQQRATNKLEMWRHNQNDDDDQKARSHKERTPAHSNQYEARKSQPRQVWPAKTPQSDETILNFKI